MRRIFVSFLSLASFSVGPLRAEGIDPSQQQYMGVYLNARKAGELEDGGNLQEALSVYQDVVATLSAMKQANPNYQKEMVDWRLKQTMEAIDRVQAKLGGDKLGGDKELPDLFQPETLEMKTGAAPKGVRPLVVETAPPKAGTKAPTRKTEPLKTAGVDVGDPLKSIQNRIDSLEQQLADANGQLAEANQQLTEVKAQNTTITQNLSVVSAARKKAEDLAEIYQSNVLDLKNQGDENEARAKDLAVQLAAAKKLNAQREADLRAAEERIEQLLARSKTVAKKAGKVSEVEKEPEATKKETSKETPKGTAKNKEDRKVDE